jgi:hypothetical protein
MASKPDAVAQSELDSPVNEPAYCGFLDILGDPIRVTSSPYSIAFSGTGDGDLDGYTFHPGDGRVIEVSPVEAREGGGSSVTCTLSGMVGVDTDLLNLIGDRSNWQGRVARLWTFMIDPDGDRIGNIWSFYTGYMTTPKIGGDDSRQTITLTIEGWLSFMSQASGRTWLAQPRYDSGDHSAEAAIAIANGTKGAALVGNPMANLNLPDGPIFNLFR